MTEPIVLALIASVTSTVAASLAAIIGYINSKKADIIHVAVNSNLTKVKQELEESKELIILLQKKLEGKFNEK